MNLGAYLLDTSVAIDLLRHDPVAEGRRADADEVVLSLVVAGELYLGAENSTDPGEHRKIDEFLDSVAIVADDVETALTYARIKYDLRRRGRPIPDNDLWIAAAAIRHGLILATRDRHFEAVTGLDIDRWED
jgi:tRNA(fMet)-specific endonuclease VapC